MSTNELRAQMMFFSEGFYDKPIDDVKEIIEVNSPVKIVYIEFSYKQLGKDEKWFIATCARVSNNKMKIRREILLKRIRGSSLSPFEPEDLEEISSYQQEPIEEVYINEVYPLHVYEKLNKNIPYIVGVDVAAGRFGDNTAVTVLDPYTVRPVAEFKSNITSTPKLKGFLIRLVAKYIPKAIVVIENNNMGSSVIDDLLLSPIGHNLYFDSNKYFIPDANKKMDAKGFAVMQARNARSYGINTNVKTRDTMINLLFDRVQNYKKDFVTRFTIEDLNALVRTPLGKVQAMSGAHDDSIMSYLIALFTYTFGTNLERYGFNRGDATPVEEKPKTRQQYFEELPPEIRAWFGDVASMQTSDEYDMMRKEFEDRQRSKMKEFHGTASRNVDYEYNEDADMNFEKNDLSWLYDLNK